MPTNAPAASSALSRTTNGGGNGIDKGKGKDMVVLSVAASSEPPPLTLARPFRSRKNRPCDGCRRAKTRCAITETGQPCVECQQTRKKCTFDEQPRERKKPAAKRPSAALESHSEDQTFDSYQTRASTSDVSLSERPVAKRQKTEAEFTGRKDNSLELSIAETAGLRYHVITSVLTDDLLPMGRVEGGQQGEYIRQISLDSTRPQYLIFTRRNTDHRPPIIVDPLTDVRLALSILSPPPPEERFLLDLYLSTSNAAFPILPPYEQEWLSNPSLYSKTLIASLNHCAGGIYRQHVRSTRKIAARNGTVINRSHDIEDRETMARNSSLTVITDAVFDLSARPSPNAEENYLLLARTVAEAQLLGLHVDSTSWAIPEWEKDYRRMLWWSLRIHDSWSSFLNARPSHIQSNNHTVPLPSVTSVLSMAQVKTSSNHAPPKVHSFFFLCQLAILVSRLQTQVCTLMTPKEERLGRVVEIEKEVAELLKEVSSYNLKSSTMPGFVSLMTCLMGFRCMVRRIIIELSIGLGAPFTPDPDTLELYAHAVDYVCTLDGPAFDGFWLIHCGHILSSMMSSLIRLSLATTSAASTANSPGSRASSPPPMMNGAQRYPNHQPNAYLRVDSQNNPIFLLCRLRRVLQNAKDAHNWDIGDAALARADRVAACLKPGGEEFENVVQALRGEFVTHHIPLPMSTTPSPATTTPVSAYPVQPAPISANAGIASMDQQMHQQPLYQPQQQRQYQQVEDVRVHPQHHRHAGNTNWNIDLNVFGGMGLDPWVNQSANGGFPGVGMWGDSPSGSVTEHYYPGANGHGSRGPMES